MAYFPPWVWHQLRTGDSVGWSPLRTPGVPLERPFLFFSCNVGNNHWHTVVVQHPSELLQRPRGRTDPVIRTRIIAFDSLGQPEARLAEIYRGCIFRLFNEILRINNAGFKPNRKAFSKIPWITARVSLAGQGSTGLCSDTDDGQFPQQADEVNCGLYGRLVLRKLMQDATEALAFAVRLFQHDPSTYE